MNIEKMGQQQLRLVASESQNKGEALYASKVLQKKNIEGLLHLRKKNIDGQSFYDYSILGFHTMQEAWDGKFLSEKELDYFFYSLNQTLHQLEEFLLRPEQLCLNPSYIMYDVAKKKWNFLYIVELYERQQEDVRELLDFFISKLGGVGNDEDKIYEYLSDCLQFEEGIRPSEMVHIWEEKQTLNIPEKAREEEPTEEKSVQEVYEETDNDDYMDEECKITWKDRWNKLIYAKLYLVPFCSD